jgi:hypothetical protein
VSCRQETKLLPLRSKTSLNCIFHIDIFYVPVILAVISYVRDITRTSVARESAKCKLDLGVLKIRLGKRGTVKAGDIIFSIEEESKIINWEQNFWYTNE